MFVIISEDGREESRELVGAPCAPRGRQWGDVPEFIQ
jgi:hypothetical protein